MSEQRRHRLRLEISREAARLFWDRGVAATSGDQIAQIVGLSTRTVWRHFRSKESCAEPIVTKSVEWGMAVLRDWPRHLSLEEHFAAEVAKYGVEYDSREAADVMLATKMIRLSDHESPLRTAWLMACDQVEHEMVGVVAKRLDRPAHDVDVRIREAAASAAFRVVNEQVGAALVSGSGLQEFGDVPGRVARAIRDATGGALGDALVS
ncbi:MULTISPECIES: TetR/AcrR family transcriptional regulator [Streptomyces]|uniref:TetR/AcrR family transcriptional regulator n=1 Tax=Streptomyces lycopersici TaxID=2974589 RepID=UPI0021D3D2AB|nr:TetR/AcrR family transcriptional regulator [Streptomyces sp. NEAU-383]